MRPEDLRPNITVYGPLFPEPVQVIVANPLGCSIKLIGKGLRTSKVYEPILSVFQIGQLQASPAQEPFDGDAAKFRLGIEAMRLGLAYEYDPYFSLSIARVDPLPHQLEAVYDYFIKLPRIRFLLADDPGAGNPIVAGCPSTPQLVEYNTGEELRRIIQNFVQSSREQGCDPSTTYVITRGKNTLNEIVPGTVPSAISPWVDNAPDTPAIMQSKYLYDNLDFPQALRLLRRVFGDDKATERGPCFGLLQCLPVTRNATLGGWIATASEVLLSCEEPFRSLRLGLKRRSPKCDYPQLGFADVFGAARPAEPRPDFQLATVHAVKGRSLDAVLLALKTKGGTGPTYQSLLRGNPRVQDQEELRLVYVAMTRAKKLLTIAVPGADQAAWSGYFQLPLQQVQPTHPGRRLTRAPAARS